jgi:hypothetical protein
MDFPFTDVEQVCAPPREMGVRAVKLPGLPFPKLVCRVQANTRPQQRFVIAEAIKTSSIPVEKLLSLVDDGDLHPAWQHMLLPLGTPYPKLSSLWAPGCGSRDRGIQHANPACLTLTRPLTRL